MLSNQLLIALNTEVKKAVDKLFEKAHSNQAHEGDLLLTIVHAFYNNDVILNNSPYVFGPGSEGLIENSQNDFIKQYIKNSERISSLIGEVNFLYQFELMLYLKVWESDLMLKRLYNLCRLIQGEEYDWDKVLNADTSRKHLIDHDIKKKTQRLIPKFYNLIDEIYLRQIRNAAAHSQFRITSTHIILYNTNVENDMPLKNVTLDCWTNIFHKTLLLQNAITANINKYDKIYRSKALGKQYGHLVKLGNGKENWIRLENSNNLKSRWIWYNNRNIG